MPHFKLAAQRAGRTSTLLVPASLAAPARHSRLLAFLGKEKWAVAGGALPPLRSGGAGDASAEQLHAAELLFVRDVLGPLRRRATTPVPEKVRCSVLLY